MKKMLCIVAACILVAIAFMPLAQIFVFGESDISIVIDGQKVSYHDAKPYISKDGRTMVPVRIVAENMGAKVEWKPQEKEVVITKDQLDPLVLTIDKYYYYLLRDWSTYLKEAITGDTKTVIDSSNGRTYVPLRVIGEYFGSKIEWIPDTRTVNVATGKGIPGTLTKVEKVMVEDKGYRFEAKEQVASSFGNSYIFGDYFYVMMGTDISSYEISINTNIIDNFEKQLKVTKDILEQKYPQSVVAKVIELMKSKMYASEDIEKRTRVELWHTVNIPEETKYIFVRSIGTDGNIEIAVNYKDKKF